MQGDQPAVGAGGHKGTDKALKRNPRCNEDSRLARIWDRGQGGRGWAETHVNQVSRGERKRSHTQVGGDHSFRARAEETEGGEWFLTPWHALDLEVDTVCRQSGQALRYK